jgi:hypothetical protein
VDDLIAFLAARLDENEALAKAAQAPSPWKAADHESDHWIVTDATGEPLIYDEGTPSLEEAAHIARHDPARSLRDVEADRKLIVAYRQTLSVPPTNEQVDQTAWRLALEFALQLRAAVYSDHPDYRPEWAP